MKVGCKDTRLGRKKMGRKRQANKKKVNIFAKFFFSLNINDWFCEIKKFNF